MFLICNPKKGSYLGNFLKVYSKDSQTLRKIQIYKFLVRNTEFLLISLRNKVSGTSSNCKNVLQLVMATKFLGNERYLLHNIIH